MNPRDVKHVMIAESAHRLASQAMPVHTQTRASRHYELSTLAACVLMKFYLDLSYRGMEDWLSKNNKVCQAIGLSRIPDHTTLQRTYHKVRNLDFKKMKGQITQEIRWKKYNAHLNDQESSSGIGNSPWISRLMVIWLAGIIAFLPIKILNFPLNFELVDTWTIAGMPVMLYLYSLKRPRFISLSYTIPMWFVLISSLISAFASPAPTRSIIVIFKEVYLFIWFIVIMALLFQLNARDLRRVLRIWSLVVIFHGALMIAQFLSPALWKFTNALGGNSANLEGYRAAGLFICDKAGCANKAAFYQLLGFVPLVLAGYSRKKTAILGIFLFTSMMSSGSMGATIALSSGLIVSLVVIAYLKKSLSMLIKNFFRIVLAVSLVGGMLFIVGSQNPDTLNHFRKIIIGRFDKSSGGRFNLWSRGIDVLLEHNAFFWGVGPENFRIVDAAQTDNQLHNDTLAFLVERGLLGLIGLALFAGITFTKGVHILQIYRKFPKRARIGVVVFLGALMATIVESLTHQIFHTRELWVVLAVQEAVLYKMMTSEHGIEPVAQPIQETVQDQPKVFVGSGAIFES